MNASWHAECFLCEMCKQELADTGFIKNSGRALCHECNAKVKARGLGKYICHKCHAMIDDQPLKFRGEVYHPYHFNCSTCGVELDANAREVRNRPGLAKNDTNELYCLRCHDKMGVPICGACRRPIEERVVTALGKHWHVEHFVCAKCEKPFFGHRHYEKKGLAYCETHYHQLFGNLCHHCNQVIAGDVFTALNKAWCVHHFACSVCDQKMNQKTKFYECDLKPVCRVIKAMNASWHAECFLCEMCKQELADTGFIKNSGRALCHECNAKVKARGLGKYICHKCHAMIDDQPLKFRGEVYHPYHFNCSTCGVELDANAREVRNRPGLAKNDTNELYCLRCHDKMGVPICGACRRPIEERVVTALGKHWHVEHFVCAKCEKPFFGHRHYEKKGLAYCETHYHQLFGNLCHHCNQVIAGDVFTALNKAWCVHHFACSVCDQKMNQKTKFYECDLKPVCKKCYEKFPKELRNRLRRQHEAAPRRAPTPVE
ncbi:hypothetical protein YQE_04438, partial [Dendroctonus ponderosae]